MLITINMEEFVQFSFDPCDYHGKALSFQQYMDKFTMQVLKYDVIDYFDEKDYQSEFDCVLYVRLTYLPTNKTMDIKYEKYRFEDMQNLKTIIVRYMKNQTKKFNTGTWEEMVDKDGEWYTNKELNTIVEGRQCFKALQKQSEDFKTVLGDDYESFMQTVSH